ncbi:MULTISPECIES: DnaA ATPase domain-containing protein [unclassified Moraxella]|uniref:DnaA ATPase domain-containing protein n=1 Tax=unclassified Moraxella TaxID=2685852 RepID=UPI002B402E1F|nr:MULTISPECIES: DnaA/Hda family protein [unclassified Moraxella]
MNDLTQPSLNLDLKQDASLSDFAGLGFTPVLKALHELRSGNLRELFIIGDFGFGKTHLAAAIYRDYTQNHKKNAISLSFDDMINSDEDVSALAGLEMFDLIIIDDLHLIERSREWQEGLFHLINRVREQGRQMVFLSESPARELEIGLLDLMTRLSLAPTFRLPTNEDIDDRRKLLDTILRRKNWRLPEQIFDYMLNQGPRNAGDMIQVLDKISPLLTHLSRVQVPKKTIDEAKNIINKETFLLEISEHKTDT